MRACISMSLAALFLIVAMSTDVSAADADFFANTVQPTLRKSCVKCHGGKDKVEGEVNLFELRSAADLTKNPKLLESMIEALSSADMPPEDEPPLDPEKRKQLVTQLRSLLHAAVTSRNTLPQTPIRRNALAEQDLGRS